MLEASATTSSGRTTSATGARRSACSSSTCSTSARTRPRRAAVERPRTPSTRRRGQVRRRPGRSPTARRGRVVALQGGDAGDAGTVAASSSTQSQALLQRGLRPARGHADRRRHRRRELATTPMLAGVVRRARGSGGSRGSATARCACSRRASPAGTATGAADRPQVRRRLRLRHDGPRHHPATGSRNCTSTGCSTSSAPRRRCTSRWSSRPPAGRLAARRRRGRCTSQFGNVLGADGKMFRTRVRRRRSSWRPAGRGGRPRAAGRRRRTPDSTRRPRRDRPAGRHRRGEVRRPLGRP